MEIPVSGSVANDETPVNGVCRRADTSWIADFVQAERTRRVVEAAPSQVRAAALAGAALAVANAVLAVVLVPSLVPGTMIGGEMVRAALPEPSAVAALTTVNCCRYASAEAGHVQRLLHRRLDVTVVHILVGTRHRAVATGARGEGRGLLGLVPV